ncbi:hypothetical protein DFH94DRAFT_691578 [Russula ochroleuca]|uniref:Uncharacterized protein n=1 Tax=Russula ochroleuca TaxID=152965 RepID=A0A9P5TAI6_9AGAM|nr:hypothetical protein DFH94DRAFT_691578 [Russula ochroleuca]
MLSLPSQSMTSADAREAAISMGNIQDALKPITELLTSTHEDSVRLFCTVPTWSPSSDICLDLHDLNTLRSRSLHFIHDLVNSLRESGVTASYKLMPSNSPLCLICACHSRLDTNAIQLSAQDAYTKMKTGVRERVLLVELEDGPALVVT